MRKRKGNDDMKIKKEFLSKCIKEDMGIDFNLDNEPDEIPVSVLNPRNYLGTHFIPITGRAVDVVYKSYMLIYVYYTENTLEEGRGGRLHVVYEMTTLYKDPNGTDLLLEETKKPIDKAHKIS